MENLDWKLMFTNENKEKAMFDSTNETRIQ